jgi:heme exporter protein D
MGVVPALILLSLLIYWCVQRRRRILAERAAEQAIRMEYQANQQQMDVFTNSVMIFDKEKDICAICLEG